MHKLSYKAVDKKGKVKKGVYFGEIQDMILWIKKQDYFLICCNEIKNHKYSLKKRVSYKELSVISSDFYMLIKSGIPIMESVNILYKQCSIKVIKENLLSIAELLKKGRSLSYCFKSYEDIYPEFFISMIQIGEESGKLEEALLKISEYYKKEYEIISKIKNALIYPCMLLFSMLILIFILIFNVIPKFSNIFSEMNVHIPWYTKKLINFSIFFKENAKIIGFLFFIFMLYILFYNKVIRNNKTNIFNANIFARQFKKLYELRFIRTFQMMIESGANINECLYNCMETVENEYYKDKILKIIENVNNGESLTEAFKNSNLFQPFVISMIEIGEESGTLDRNLINIYEILDKRFYEKIQSLISYMEPLMIIIIGIVVGFNIIMFIMPIITAMTDMSM